MSMLVPTVICGGVGARLWPVSRESHPKPFIRLSDGQSLLQKAFLRGATLDGAQEILTVTNRELFFKTEDEYRQVNTAGLATSFILEPFGRNTAAALAAAALHVERAHGEDAVLLVLPADHLIADQAAFAGAVKAASRLAAEGRVVAFGIRPEHPETGYGYIEANGSDVVRFVEKPSREKAEEYVSSGRFLWNSGMFCFSAGTMVREMEAHCPSIINGVRTTMEQSRLAEGKGFTQVELDAESFRSVPDDSIDYAVMEKSSAVSVVPCSVGWSDIGSWTSLSQLTDADENGNRIEGEAMLHDATNCYIQSRERIVGAVGVKDIIVIDTPDALLIAHQSRSQDVKLLFSELKARGHEAHKLHRTVYRPWGSYTVLEEGSRFKIKRIVVKPGQQLSLQMHHHRSEHWVIVSGMAKVINGEDEMLVNTNESTFIPAGHRHRLENPGVIDLVMIEVQSGEFLGEEDIVRFEDSYGRA